MGLYRPYLIIISISLLLIISGQFKLLQPLVSANTAFIEPVIAAENSSTHKAVSLFSIITSIRDLARENGRLREENNNLRAELGNLKEVHHENEVLRSELTFAQKSQQELLPAQLIGRTSVGIIKDLILNQGLVHGVVVGQPVLSQGYLVGTVSSVTDKQSTVLLLSNPRSKIPVMGQDGRASGILQGGISGLTITELLADADIKSTESVVTSGLGGLLPQGIPIGNIIEVQSRSGDITKKATVRSPLDIGKLEMVFIGKSGS